MKRVSPIFTLTMSRSIVAKIPACFTDGFDLRVMYLPHVPHVVPCSGGGGIWGVYRVYGVYRACIIRYRVFRGVRCMYMV